MKQNRIIGLDGIRTIAIIGIIIYHAYPTFLPGGFLGVMAFFMLMGYLMVYGSQNIIIKTPVESALTYYKKKIKRLYPSLLILLTVVLLAMAIFFSDYPKRMFGETASIILGYNNWWQIFQNASYFDRLLNTSPLTHLWYIGLTVQYYILWPIFYIGLMYFANFVERKASGWGHRSCWITMIVLAFISVLILIIGFSPEKDPSRLYYGTDARAFSLLTGMLIGMLPIDEIRTRYGQYKFAFIGGASACLLLIYGAMAVATGESASTYHFYMPMTNLIYAILLICILISTDTVGKFFEKTPFVLVGKYSYELYLTMYPCLWLLGKNKYISSLPIAIHVLVVAITIGLASVALYHASRFVTDFFKHETILPDTLHKFAPALLLVICLTTCGIQSVVSFAFGGEDEMTHLATELKESKETTRQDNSALLAQVRSSQLGSISTNADDLLTQIENNLSARQAAQAADPNASVEPAEVVATTPIIPPVLNATAIGDSVMLGASSTMMGEIGGLYVDAAKNRRVADASDIITNLKNQNLLASTLIIHLGTNSVASAESYQSVLDAIGDTKCEIYWLNICGAEWSDEVNVSLNELAAAHDNIHILDWNGYSAAHPEWFSPDHIHLTTDGKTAYTSFIKESIGL